MLPDVAKMVASLAPGKKLSVVMPDGKAYALPPVPEPPIVDPPDPMEIAAKELLDRDVASRALIESMGKNFADVLARVDSSIGVIADGQKSVVQSVGKLEGAMLLPVKPVYDKSGKLIAAKRG